MSLLRRPASTRPAVVPSRRRTSVRFRPGCENLEDRTVLATALAGQEGIAALALHGRGGLPLAELRNFDNLLLMRRMGEFPRGGLGAFSGGRMGAFAFARSPLALRLFNELNPGSSSTATASSPSASTAPVSVVTTSSPTSGNTSNPTNTTTTSTTPTSNSSPTALPTTTVTTASTTTTTGPSPSSSSTSPSDPTLLTVSLNPIDLNLLGLEVKLYGQDTSSPVTVTVSAQPGSGELLGNLLTDAAGLLNVQGVSNALNNVLNSVVSLVNQSTLSVNAPTSSTPTPSSTTTVLDAYIAPVHLNLLGAVVDTSPIHLQILANSGTGLLLGNIVTDLANLLNNTTGNVVHDIENGLTNLLNELNQLFPTIAGATTPATTSGTTTTAASNAGSTSSGSLQFLSLTVPPIDLNLLGLILQTSTIQVNATSQSGTGDLLGNLINDLVKNLNVAQSDLNTINSDLNGVLAKVVGILNATTLTLPANAVSSLSAPLQQLASPTLVNTSGGTVAPQPVLNLNIASNNGNPPVDVNLLGVVVTTSNIQVQLSAQPGQGQILGNLVYNVSHLLDGGLLSVLGLLNQLGI